MRRIGRSHQQVRQASHSPLLHRERDDHPQMLVTRGGSSVGIEVDAKARRVESAAPWLRKIASVIEAVPPARTTSGRCRVGIRAGSASDLCRPLRACAAPCWKRRWASRAACKVCGAISLRRQDPRIHGWKGSSARRSSCRAFHHGSLS